MRAHANYFRYVVRHKWFVFLECCRLYTQLPYLTRSPIPAFAMLWLAIAHDWSKFRPSEFFPYADFFYGKTAKARRDTTGYYKPTDTGHFGFDEAWFNHQKRNKHHWQWWCQPTDDGSVKAMQMPVMSVFEMLADWRGAGRAQGTPDTVSWYAVNKGKMTLHPVTRDLIEILLGVRR